MAPSIPVIWNLETQKEEVPRLGEIVKGKKKPPEIKA
jgi:hypothetical protein